ncbi:CBS domain-containing protein [Paucilactobacillus nenjiangensis]|uniref:CBS domain-containing protein n=1 Tax=Paucilactobacillus nenjiangensis TaxID=1296540 RepID=UPI0028D2F34B|nr:CBS domain-containing protein [Paucilactobacillus nenjiangensis]
MSVADFMTTDLVTIRLETRINDEVDLMKKHDIHRLPVVDNGKLVGLVTEGIIQRALPSEATSLSVYEVNYLLNKTTVDEIMEKDVRTIKSSSVLEEAIYQMRKNNIGVLPVVDDGHLTGIITNNDIFDAFLNVAAYGNGGTSVTVHVPAQEIGFLAKVSEALASHKYNILSLFVVKQGDAKAIELHVDSEDETGVKNALKQAGLEE